MSGSAYVLDPDDPRAPTDAQWAAMSAEERRRAVDALPSELPRALPPEGDPHRIPKERALEALREYFRRLRRRVYLSSELPVYYPGERVVAPDVIAVLDVEPGPRMKWVVAVEGKGLDFALEVLVAGGRAKDLEHNVSFYARLGIPEYFVYDALRTRIVGYRLAPGRKDYQPIVPQEGRWESTVLGLDLAIDGGRVRFFHGSAPLPEAEELIVKLGAMVDDVVKREEALARELEAETRRADDANARAERLAARLRALGIDPDAEG
ncbi:MAG TPA: Uma2 family endonuclease [Minicystis sp.]|nr:Uma2 family endonuclease [Minicystis sp.]